jgi:hypothetical protein
VLVHFFFENSTKKHACFFFFFFFVLFCSNLCVCVLSLVEAPNDPLSQHRPRYLTYFFSRDCFVIRPHRLCMTRMLRNETEIRCSIFSPCIVWFLTIVLKRECHRNLYKKTQQNCSIFRFDRRDLFFKITIIFCHFFCFVLFFFCLSRLPLWSVSLPLSTL